MKKLLAIILSLAMLLTMFGCTGESAPSKWQAKKIVADVVPKAEELAKNIMSFGYFTDRLDRTQKYEGSNEGEYTYYALKDCKYSSISDIKEEINLLFSDSGAKRMMQRLDSEPPTLKEIDGKLCATDSNRGFLTHWEIDTMKILSITKDRIVVKMEMMSTEEEIHYADIELAKVDGKWLVDNDIEGENIKVIRIAG